MFRTSAILAASAIVAISYGTANADFTAYNDLGGNSSGNATSIQYGAALPSASDTASGILKDYSTGNSTGVTLTLSTPSGFTAVGQDTGASNGAMGASGTDAYATFNGKINAMGYLWYNDTTTSRARLTFSGLSASAVYEVSIFGNRAGNYTDRYGITEIGSVDSYTNTSSVGSTISGATTSIMVGNNTAAGYIAKYSAITAGVDGTFYIDVYGGPTGAGNGHKWYANAVSLSEVSVPEPASLSVLGLTGLLALKRRRAL